MRKSPKALISRLRKRASALMEINERQIARDLTDAADELDRLNNEVLDERAIVDSLTTR